MKISVFGVGYVGAVSSGCFASLGHEVIAVDVSEDKIDLINRGVSPIVEAEIDRLISDGVRTGRLRATADVADAVANSDMSLICVGTPSRANGTVSMQAVDEVVRSLGAALRDKAGTHLVVMRSTVPPGTAEGRVIPALEEASGRRAGEGFRYYSNPEFMREGTSVRDFHAPPYTLIGAAAGDAAREVRSLYANVQADIHVAGYKTIESVKFLSNAYHAVKLAFANEAGGVLAACGVDARAAFDLFREDRVLNVSPAYLRPGFAFGGSCLPKDIRHFLALADGADVAAPLMRQVLPSNDAVIERAFAHITRHGRQPVALFGLAFKPGTDDLRESAFVRLAERLLSKGYPLKIYDRSVQVARLLGSNLTYIEREIPHLGDLMVGSVEAAVDGAGVVVVGHVGGEDRAALLAALGGYRGSAATVVDLVGVPDLAARAGYQGFCW